MAGHNLCSFVEHIGPHKIKPFLQTSFSPNSQISREWCAILEFRFHEFVAHDGAIDWFKKLGSSLKIFRQRALNLFLPRYSLSDTAILPITQVWPGRM